jgi:hypothetical protein
MLWASRPMTNKHLNKKLYKYVHGKPRIWNSRCVDPLKGVEGVLSSDVTCPHILEICVICHWLLKRGITLSWIICKIHYSERWTADRATTDASLQISSNFYFKFWTLVPPSLSIFVKCQMDRGKSLMRRDQWCNRGGLLVIPPAATRVMWLGHTQSGSRPLSALNLPFHISLHNLCPSVCQWTVRGA